MKQSGEWVDTRLANPTSVSTFNFEGLPSESSSIALRWQGMGWWAVDLFTMVSELAVL